MALFGRSASGHVARPQEDAGFKSLGLKALFEVLGDERRYRFLDLGCASGSNLQFLSKYASRIRVEDLFGTLLARGFFELRGDDPREERAFEEIIPLNGEERFDVILAWDLWNYLRLDEIHALTRQFERLSSDEGFVFALSSTLKEMPSSPMAFRIIDTETLLYVPTSADSRPCPRYVPRDLALVMPGFRTQSSFLLRNGMREYLLVRSRD